MATTPSPPTVDACSAPSEHGACAPSAQARAPWVVLLVAVSGCVAVGMSGSAAGVLPACPFRAMTGLDCPGCGMTRGMRQLLRGHPLAALDHNVLLVVLVPLVAWSWLVWVGAPVPRLPRLSTRASWLVVGLLGLFAVVRNLPLPGCRWLASS